MDLDQFAAAVEEAITELPPAFRTAVANVAVLVEDWPDRETLDQMGLDSPGGLLGLYHGVPLPERGASYGGALPDRIFLYRRPILNYCGVIGEPVAACLRTTLIHELGHYLGYTEAELAVLEASGRGG